ncbi:hypothetical protein OG21DRAFT_1156027 [Imleria badia]|nr:hypothetical protein OG21DRAFT_1156027 [Imleria badia]
MSCATYPSSRLVRSPTTPPHSSSSICLTPQRTSPIPPTPTVPSGNVTVTTTLPSPTHNQSVVPAPTDGDLAAPGISLPPPTFPIALPTTAPAHSLPICAHIPCLSHTKVATRNTRRICTCIILTIPYLYHTKPITHMHTGPLVAGSALCATASYVIGYLGPLPFATDARPQIRRKRYPACFHLAKSPRPVHL